MADRPPEAKEKARPGLVRALARRVGLAAKPPENAIAPPPAADLMAQARAFQSLAVEDVMTPRADIVAIELSAPFEAVVAAFLDSEHSRLPVYRETLDDPVGVAHLKDLFKLLAAPNGRPAFDAMPLARMKRETLYVPPSMLAADLLLAMRTSRVHMAMVIDEFGGVDGLVTLEDVIEAVVGEIDDEHDEAHAVMILPRAGGVFEVDGRADLAELETALGRGLVTEALAEEDIDTAAGLVTALAGRLPRRGEVIGHPSGLDFEITEADPRRVRRLRVRPTPPPAATVPPPRG